MSREIPKGSTDQSTVIRIVDSGDGTPETGVTSATGGLALSYRRETAASVSISPISDLAALTTAHTDGGILHIGQGYYRVDPPDAAWANSNSVNGVLVHGTVTGMVVIGAYHPLIISQSGGGAITTTITVNDGSNPIAGVQVWVSTDSAGANIVAGPQTTNGSGQVTFYLDAGSYYAWKELAGYNFTNPESMTVS